MPPEREQGAETEGEALAHPLVQSVLLEPCLWRLWSAVAVLRWLEARTRVRNLRVVYRSKPSLSFPPSEIHDIALTRGQIQVVINALGVASSGSPLPSSDVMRVIADYRANGALSLWLDAITDRLAHAAESSMRASVASFASAIGAPIAAHLSLGVVCGTDAPLSATPAGALLRPRRHNARGALALGALFLGAPSAHGLARLIEALTGLHARVEEFAEGEMLVAMQMHVGSALPAIPGERASVAASALEVHINDVERPLDAFALALNRVRLRALEEAALAYIGDSSPAVRFVLWVRGDDVRTASLGSRALLGCSFVPGTVKARRLALPVSLTRWTRVR